MSVKGFKPPQSNIESSNVDQQVSRALTEVPSDRTFYFTPDVSVNDSSISSNSNRKRPLPPQKQENSNNKRTIVDLVTERGPEPDWESNRGCFTYLQSFYKHAPSMYLSKKKNLSDNRAGYVIGRHGDRCDLVIMDVNVSREHCLIYMETGSNGVNKGIRIYLECLSQAGTWVDNTKLSPGQRILLRGGNTIGLYTQNRQPLAFFTVRFPPVFEANNCEHEYQFVKELGKGNFATVYEAYIKNTKNSVAIKVMSKAYFNAKPKLLASIIQEMSIMMQLEKHPLVVQMKEIFNEKHRIFLVLEFVPGGELFDCIKEKSKFSEDEARFVFWQLLNAIKYLHRQGIAHRDLKPENVLLFNREKLHIKVSDFGLAKKQDKEEFFGSQCGTPNYVAPEVLDPTELRAYTLQCDMWSLGVMLYVCLCGFAPFSDDYGPPSMKAQIKMGKFDFPSPYWDNISVEAKDLVKSLLTVDHIQRATADEALDMAWMKQEPRDMEKRRLGLGIEALNTIDRLNKYADLDATQVPTETVAISYES